MKIQYLTTVYILKSSTMVKELFDAIERHKDCVLEFVDTPIPDEWSLRVYRKLKD